MAELAAKRDWDAIVVGGGHNGLTAAAYLARAGKSVLVLERRERLGGAATLERPFSDDRYVVSPCAYVVGLLDQLVIDELDLAQARPALLGRRSQPLGPVRRRQRLRAVARPGQDAGEPRAARRLEEGHRRLLGLRGAVRRRPQAAAQGRPRHLGRRHPDPRRDRGPARRLAGDDRPRLRGVDRRRARRSTSTTSASRRRSSARGSSAPGAGPTSPARRRSSSCTTRATSTARARCGATSRAAWGCARSRSPTPPPSTAPCSPAASRWRGSPRARASRSRTAPSCGRGTVICNADPKRMAGLLADTEVDGGLPRAARRVEDPQPGGQVQRPPRPAAELDRGAGRDLARPGDGRRHRHDGRGAGRVRALRGRRARGRLRRDLHPDRLRPEPGSGGQAPAERLRPVRAVRHRRVELGRGARRRRASSSST